MFDSMILFADRTHAFLAEPVPETFEGWLRRPEFVYPLAFALALFLLVVALRAQDLAAWWRARHREVLRPIDLEQMFHGTPMVMLDLRPPEAFNGPKGHLPGSLNVPPELLKRRLGEVAKDKRMLVVLVDDTDRIAHRVAPQVKAEGYMWVRVLQGGVRAWRSQALPVSVKKH